jgi:hypothetical protein
MPNVFERGLGPVDDDHEGEYQTAEGVKPPYSGVEADCVGFSVSNSLIPQGYGRQT